MSNSDNINDINNKMVINQKYCTGADTGEKSAVMTRTCRPRAKTAGFAPVNEPFLNFLIEILYHSIIQTPKQKLQPV